MNFLVADYQKLRKLRKPLQASVSQPLEKVVRLG